MDFKGIRFEGRDFIYCCGGRVSLESACGPCDESSVLMNGKELLEKQSDRKI